MRLCTLLVVLFGSMPALAQEDPLFPSPTGGSPTPLLFLHPLVNYRDDPIQVRDWERHLQERHSLRLNVGSVTTDDFLTDVELHVTEKLDSRWRALYDMRWLEAHHLETRPQQHFLGFELDVTDHLGVQAQFHPTSRKEEVDLRAGVVWVDSDRRRYLRLLVRWDDPLFSEKNERNGKAEQVATSLEWTTRLRRGDVELFSRGSVGSEGRHSFPDSTKSPLAAADRKRFTNSETRLRFVRRNDRFAEFEFRHHGYRAGLTPRTTPAIEESYRNDIRAWALRGVWGFSTRWLLRGEITAVHQEARRAGTTHYDYARSDWMPAAFLQWRFHRRHRFEFGAMASVYDWNGSPDKVAVAQDGTVTKVKFGWIVDFSDHARLQLSLSHEPDPNHFGGGNGQFQMFF